MWLGPAGCFVERYKEDRVRIRCAILRDRDRDRKTAKPIVVMQVDETQAALDAYATRLAAWKAKKGPAEASPVQTLLVEESVLSSSSIR